MFRLGVSDLDGRILGCGDGPASFNAEMSAGGHAVISVDPLYAASAAAIEKRVEDAFDEVMEQMRQHPEEFVWTHVTSTWGRRRGWGTCSARPGPRPANRRGRRRGAGRPGSRACGDDREGPRSHAPRGRRGQPAAVPEHRGGDGREQV